MNTRTKTFALLAVVALAVVASSLIFVMQSTVKADNNTTVASDSEPTPAAITQPTNNFTCFERGFMGFRGHGMIEREFGGRGPMGIGPIQVSSEFTANVTNIAKSDSDVQNLLTQGYNITMVRPVITTTVDGNGNMITKASTADLILVGTNGRAFVVVDLSQSKVTKIVTLTITEIDK